jgi:hypothetical protein
MGAHQYFAFVPILLQKSLPVSVTGNSVPLMRFAAELGDDVVI